MLVVETIAKIRRAYFSQGKAIKEICRDLHVSRKVVRKVIRSNATEFHYERSRQPLPRVGPWREQLEALLDENDRRTSRERLTLIRIFEDLRTLGYGGSYAAVRRYAIAWREKRASATADAYVPLSFAPGEAYQFDWSHELALIGGVTTTLKVAHVRLCHSRMMFVRAYPRESQEMVFDAHERAFAFFRGACARGIYDNMKTAVDAVFVGKDRQYNRRFLQMCSHHLVEPVACTPASGLGERSSREPGRARPGAVLHAPAAVQKLRGAQCLAARPMLGLCEGPSPYRMAGADDLGGFRGGTAEARFLSRPVRRLSRSAGLGVEDLPGAVRQQQILGERRRGRAPVEIHAYADRIVIRQDGRIVAEHERSFGRGKTIYDPWHYVPVLARKPGALRNGAPFRDWVLPGALERIRRKLAGSDDGDRQMVKLLAAVLTDGMPEVEAACAQALERGRPFRRCRSQHSGAAPRSGPSRDHHDAGQPASRSYAGRRLRPLRRLEEGQMMERAEVLDMMGTLKLYGMKAAYDETLAVALKRSHEPQRFVGDLLKAEISEKQARSIKYQLTVARPAARQGRRRLRLQGYAYQRGLWSATSPRRLPRPAA